MANKLDLTQLNANFTNGGIYLATGTATVTVGTAIPNAVVKGKFITTPLAASAVALNFVSPLDGNTAFVPATLAIGTGCVIVHCVDAAGVRKELQGKIIPVDALGNISGVYTFPNIPDSLTPVAYSTVKAITAAVIFGTTTWATSGVAVNATLALPATSVVGAGTSTQVCTLPSRPVVV